MDDPNRAARRIRSLLPVLVVVCALAQLGAVLGVTRFVADTVTRTPPGIHAGRSAGPGASGDGEQHANARRIAIGALLERRANAFRTRDREALVSTLDPQNPTFRQNQIGVFDNIAEVPFAAWEYEMVTPDAFDLPAARKSALGGPVFTAQVDLLYRITGHDVAPVRVPQFPTFVLRGGTWYLAADGDGAAAGMRTPAQVWDLGPVTVVQGTHSIVLGIGTRAALREFADTTDKAVPQVSAVWGESWPGRAVVVVPGTQAEMARLLGAEPSKYAKIAAVTTGERGAAADAAAADRVIVNPDAFRELGDLERRVVMTHEITHVASRAFTRAWTPTWLSEGFADYVGYLESAQTMRTAAPELRRDVKAGKVPVQLPADAGFETTQEDLPQAYEMGWLACKLIAERWGRAKLVELYRTVGAERPPGVGAPDSASALSSAMVSVLGTGPDAFTKTWLDYLRTQAE
ncbi:hypothetical protein [Embleya hyalina]|uniref:Uncharacterized protein n=1 Tax=Embleya hyalina TaxID=516124 RepID=A0A401YNS3_9ACTN|nr:hypothetical protein [Embleya hyalina]GCD96273.1 hypothetical protein EHYA_03958 [Embleya hyalina]